MPRHFGPSRGGYRSTYRPRRGGGGQRRGKVGVFSDVTKFVNKAVVVETAERVAPEHLFSEFDIDERLKKNIVHKGYVEPTPIQDRIIPHALRGSDVVGVADTGTGKTAAFLIPLINKVIHRQSENVLIVVPTRELAQQIDEEFQGFTKDLPIGAVVCIGGSPMGKQMADLRRRYNFVIGTPGRLKDLIERRLIDLSRFSTIVLDEADRMLDMGFIHDVRFLMAGLPQKHHTLFFSATISRDIEHLIRGFMEHPITNSIKTRETAPTVEQDIVKIPQGSTKLDVLAELLKKPEFKRVLVFGRTKHGVEKLARMLSRGGLRIESIHGNKSQPQRKKALDRFKRGEAQALIATDVAARGLDIEDRSEERRV